MKIVVVVICYDIVLNCLQGHSLVVNTKKVLQKEFKTIVETLSV